MKKQTKLTGYIVTVKEKPNTFLRVEWSGGSQTGHYRETLTTDFEAATIKAEKKELELFMIWYNASHKKKVEFEIRPVQRICTTEILIGNVEEE